MFAKLITTLSVLPILSLALLDTSMYIISLKVSIQLEFVFQYDNLF